MLPPSQLREEFYGAGLAGGDVGGDDAVLVFLSRGGGGGCTGLHVVARAGLGDGEGQGVASPCGGGGLQRHLACHVGQGNGDVGG